MWDPTGYSTSDTISSVFSVNSTVGDKTMLQALQFKGGRGLEGAERILMRAAVAAILNTSHPHVAYAISEADLLDQIGVAFGSGDRHTLLGLATEIDDLNNSSCPINAAGIPVAR